MKTINPSTNSTLRPWYDWLRDGGGRAERVLREWFDLNGLDYEAFKRQASMK